MILDDRSLKTFNILSFFVRCEEDTTCCYTNTSFKYIKGGAMKYKEIIDDTKSLFVALDPAELRTDFDTDITKVTLEYFEGQPDNQSPVFEIKLELSDNFISDTYHLSGTLSQDVKVKASLDVGERIYQEKKDALQGFESVRGLKVSERLRYIPRIDMQAAS